MEMLGGGDHFRPMAKSGSEIDPDRQTGHLPGLVGLSRLRNRNPHPLHSAGVIARLSPRFTTVFFTWGRCA